MRCGGIMKTWTMRSASYERADFMWSTICCRSRIGRRAMALECWRFWRHSLRVLILRSLRWPGPADWWLRFGNRRRLKGGRAMIPLILVLAALLAQEPAARPASSLDYTFFRDRVQPIFLAKRPGHARCIVCHDHTTPRLQELSPDAATWNDEQSRRNFEAWQRVVVPGDPMSSRMLMHPLAAAAGGDPFHAGGKHWTSQSDPEWQTLAAWVRTGAPAAKSSAPGSLDFEFYRTRIEPIFLKPRRPDEGSGNACYSCHTKVASRLRLQPLSPGATSWTEAQSLQNFEIVSRLVIPGEPLKSPLLLHPLASEAGGDPTHTGGKFWASQANPEWQVVAGWVQGGK